MKILRYPLKKKWFDMEVSGEKLEEYRDIKDHWVSRLYRMARPFTKASNANSITSAFNYCKGLYGSRRKAIEHLIENGYIIPKEFDIIEAKNGYGKNDPVFQAHYNGVSVGLAKPEWSDNWQGDVFVIKLGEIIKTEKSA